MLRSCYIAEVSCEERPRKEAISASKASRARDCFALLAVTTGRVIRWVQVRANAGSGRLKALAVLTLTLLSLLPPPGTGAAGYQDGLAPPAPPRGISGAQPESCRDRHRHMEGRAQLTGD
jgi:hypothetical protein